MTADLTAIDYQHILEFYHKPLPRSARLLKLQAEKILANKLCRCIKKVGNHIPEQIAIGTCTKTVINNKGFTRGKFKCRNQNTIKLYKTKSKTKPKPKTKTKSKSKHRR